MNCGRSDPIHDAKHMFRAQTKVSGSEINGYSVLCRCLVIAGLGDLKRPADKLSITQSSALAATGIIWSRYSLVIKPKNYALFTVNLFVAATGLYQLSRVVKHKQEQKALQSSAAQ